MTPYRDYLRTYRQALKAMEMVAEMGGKGKIPLPQPPASTALPPMKCPSTGPTIRRRTPRPYVNHYRLRGYNGGKV